MATHTLNDEEYGQLIGARRNAEQRAAELEIELARVRAEDPADRIRPLNALARAQLTIVRFAVANLPPETTRGWPAKELVRVAELLATMPDFTVDDGDLANELRAFARDCEAYALHREALREEKLRADAAAPKGDLAPTASES